MIALTFLSLSLVLTATPPGALAAVEGAPDSGAARPSDTAKLASSALAAADRAITQLEESEKRNEAKARLVEAQRLYEAGDFAASARAADEAWALVSADHKATRFRVEVAKDGETEVVATAGAAVRVEAQGVTRPLQSGQSLKVKKGEAPPLPEVLLVPAPLRPPANALLRFKRREGGLGPVTLSWSTVPGAESYEIEVLPLGGGEPLALVMSRTNVTLPGLEPGRYTWSVRSVRGQERSEASPARAFQLVEEVLKLEVKGSSWK